MDIQNGITTEFLDETQINFLNEHFNKKFPDVDAKITVNLNRKDYEDETNLECVMRYVLTYNHPISPEDETWFFIEQDGDEMDVFSGIESVINKYIIQTKTCDHEFDRPKDEYGSTYPDGRSVCTKCELALKNHLPRIPNKHVIKMSSHSIGVKPTFKGETLVSCFPKKAAIELLLWRHSQKSMVWALSFAVKGMASRLLNSSVGRFTSGCLIVRGMNGTGMCTARFVKTAMHNASIAKCAQATLLNL